MASPRRLRTFSLAMVLAVVLNVSAPDHWGHIPNPLDALVNGSHTHPALPAAAHESGPEHARHCHGNAASCSDLPLTSVGGFVALAAMLALAGAGISFGRPLPLDATMRHSWGAPPLHPPPRTSAAPS